MLGEPNSHPGNVWQYIIKYSINPGGTLGIQWRKREKKRRRSLRGCHRELVEFGYTERWGWRVVFPTSA